MAESGSAGSPLPTAALAPAAAVLDQRALGQTASVLPGAILAQNVQTVPPTPDTSVFDEHWFGSNLPGSKPEHAIFREILDEHNFHIQRLRDLRAAIIDTARQERAEEEAGKVPKTNLLETISLLLSEVYAKGILPGTVERPSSNRISHKGILDLLTRPRATGTETGFGVYEPWAAWWAGIFTSSDRVERHNVHIWEPECVVVQPDLYFQSVQAVTQVETLKTTPTPEGAKWFVSAARLLKDPKCFAEANYAINVWSEQDALTGYVWKTFPPSGGTTPDEKMPHIAFLFGSDTLLWIATQEAQASVFNGKAKYVHAFIEWGMPSSDFSGAYNIRGTYASGGVDWSGAKPTFSPFFDTKPENFGHCGYRQCAQFGGRDEFKRAEPLGLLLKTDAVAIASAKAI